MLTAAQKTTLKNHLAANTNTVVVGGTTFAINSNDVLPTNHTPPSDESAQKVADFYNVQASPDYWCWRSAVEKKEIVEKASESATSFVWAGNGFITRSVQEIECWKQLFNSTLLCNPSLTNVRQAFADIFSGAGNAALNRTHLLIVGRHRAAIGEKVLAVAGTGPGNDGGTRGTTTNPDSPGLDLSGNAVITLTPQDIKDAWVS